MKTNPLHLSFFPVRILVTCFYFIRWQGDYFPHSKNKKRVLVNKDFTIWKHIHSWRCACCYSACHKFQVYVSTFKWC